MTTFFRAVSEDMWSWSWSSSGDSPHLSVTHCPKQQALVASNKLHTSRVGSGSGSTVTQDRMGPPQ